MKDKKNSNQLIPISDAAKYLGISASTLYRYESKGIITSMRTAGGHRRYSIKELENFKKVMKSNTFKPKNSKNKHKQMSFTFGADVTIE